jgi:hypothetical protein
MIETFLIAAAAFALAMLLLSVGPIFGRRQLRGSCGGPAGRRGEKGETTCACGKPAEDCTNAAGAENVRWIEDGQDK